MFRQSLIVTDFALTEDARALRHHAQRLRRDAQVLCEVAGEARRRAERARGRSTHALSSSRQKALPTRGNAPANNCDGPPPAARAQFDLASTRHLHNQS